MLWALDKHCCTEKWVARLVKSVNKSKDNLNLEEKYIRQNLLLLLEEGKEKEEEKKHQKGIIGKGKGWAGRAKEKKKNNTQKKKRRKKEEQE